jgi:8-oxo-dGTP diphosphatase
MEPIKGVDYTGVSIIFFCHDGAGKFLMEKRGANARDEQGRWDIGGGALEFDETIDESLRKEVKEEYCTDVISYEFLGYRDAHRQKDGKPTHWIGLDFKVLVDPKKVAIGEPHKFDDMGWFTLDTMPTPIHSQLPLFLENYKGKL